MHLWLKTNIVARLQMTLGAVVTIALIGCDRPPATAGEKNMPSTSQPSVVGLDVKQRQIAFLNRIRESDPQHQTIERALLNEQSELGLVLDRTVAMDKIPQLMKTMLRQMASEFPGYDLTVLAYSPSTPPKKIGTARLNARTRDMTYTPER